MQFRGFNKSENYHQISSADIQMPSLDRLEMIDNIPETRPPRRRPDC